MKKTSRFLLIFITALTILLAGHGEALAARLGGGKSFGSRPSYSTPYNRSGGYQAGSPQQPAYQQPGMAAQRNQAAREAMGRRGGLMGMLGGLALGGLLGAMLFGGAFEHINVMDILVFGGIAFLLFKLFASRREGGLGQASVGGQSYRQESGFGYDPGYERRAETMGTGRAGFDTDILSRKGQGAATRFDPAVKTPNVPADFDISAFLEGARAAYAHLQEAWDRGDLAALRALTTDAVFAELKTQLEQRAGANRTELLRVDAEILEVRDVGGEREAIVLFDVLLRESAGQEPATVREVWHFTRSRASRQPTWFLDGIQQVEG